MQNEIDDFKIENETLKLNFDSCGGSNLHKALILLKIILNVLF